MTDTNEYERGAVFDDTAKLADFERATALLDPQWLDNAACADKDIVDFFPREGTSQLPSIDVAMTCRSCPVITECLLTAAEFEGIKSATYAKGIFAGLTPPSRMRVYKLPVGQWKDAAVAMLTDYLETKIKAQRNVPAKVRKAQLLEIGRG